MGFSFDLYSAKSIIVKEDDLFSICIRHALIKLNTNIIKYNQPHLLLQFVHRCGSKIEGQNGEKLITLKRGQADQHTTPTLSLVRVNRYQQMRPSKENSQEKNEKFIGNLRNNERNLPHEE